MISIYGVSIVFVSKMISIYGVSIVFSFLKLLSGNQNFWMWATYCMYLKVYPRLHIFLDNMTWRSWKSHVNRMWITWEIVKITRELLETWKSQVNHMGIMKITCESHAGWRISHVSIYESHVNNMGNYGNHMWVHVNHMWITWEIMESHVNHMGD